MQKIIHKLIRYSRGGVNIAADVNAVISSSEGGTSKTSVRNRNRIIQRGGRTWSESEVEEPAAKDVEHDE
jgi:hypothetical protein